MPSVLKPSSLKGSKHTITGRHNSYLATQCLASAQHWRNRHLEVNYSRM